MSVLDLLVGGGVGAIIVAAINALVNRRKLSADTDKAGAEATQVLTAAAMALVEPLEHRIRDLQAEVDTLRAAVRQAAADLDQAHDRETRKDALIAELTRAGATATKETP